MIENQLMNTQIHKFQNLARKFRAKATELEDVYTCVRFLDKLSPS